VADDLRSLAHTLRAVIKPPVAPARPHEWKRPTGVVDDPWAWLADRDDAETIAYLEAENSYADEYFAEQARAALVDTVFQEIKSRVQETDLSVPVLHGGWWYVTRTIEGQSYPVFCRSRDEDVPNSADLGSGPDDSVILDCNAEAEGHEYFDVHDVEPSPDHTLLGWSSDVDGSERYTLRVRDLSTGRDADEIAGTSSWGGVAWSAGNDWLFYAKPDDQMRPHQIWRHRLGTTPADDVLVHSESDERFFLQVSSTRSGRWLIITSASKTSGESFVLRADDPEGVPALVRARTPDVEYAIDDWGDRFVVLTSLDAPDFRLMAAPHDDPGAWSDLVAHEPGRRLTEAEPFADHLVLHEWEQAQPRVRVLRRDGTYEVLDFGEEPHDLTLGANPEWTAATLRLTYQSLTTPPSVFDHHLATGERVLRKQTPTPGVDLGAYAAVRTWASTADGVAVPVDVVRHRETPLDGTAPCVVYAYGAYEYSLAPWFSVARLSLLDRGVAFALVHPRGGGELGRSWYLDGKLLNKRNTFTDTIAASDHLVASGIADGARLALRGGSAGGLLVGACITMRPERFAAAVAEVPFVDVVTTMSDPSLPLTVTEWEEWGDPRSEPFASYMAGYSPYDNTVAADYPAIYVTAGLNDPRVSYHEPAKWVARLRSVGAGVARPLVLRTEMGAGHGGRSGRYDAWLDEARVVTFLVTELSR
jgi:oligopeptidase B